MRPMLGMLILPNLGRGGAPMVVRISGVSELFDALAEPRPIPWDRHCYLLLGGTYSIRDSLAW